MDRWMVDSPARLRKREKKARLTVGSQCEQRIESEARRLKCFVWFGLWGQGMYVDWYVGATKVRGLG